MKLILLCNVAVAATAAIREPKLLVKKQFPGIAANSLGPVTAALGLGGKVPAWNVTRVDDLMAMGSKQWGAKRVKIRYGPYHISGSNRGSIGKLMDGQGGLVWNLPDRNIQKPCRQCMITFMQAGLDDTMGNPLTRADGVSLHHLVLINSGPGLKDATCGSHPTSRTHLDVGTNSFISERFFSSGAEQDPVDFTDPKLNVGYYVSKRDTFDAIIGLMNTERHKRTVYLTMTWEYIPGVPRIFSNIRPVFLDAANCGLSDTKPKSQNGPFDLTSKVWTSDFDGHILGISSHLHDGGVYLNVLRNDMLVCHAVPDYNEPGPYVEPTVERPALHRLHWHSMSNSALPNLPAAKMHIGAISWCQGSYTANNPLGTLLAGDRWDLTAHYDYRLHAGDLRTDGKQADVMALALMYVAVPLAKLRMTL